jgi:aldehyde:ferredoxin oxidoreductase
VLGQEMGGYATGEVFFASQALGLRHSHLDSGGYSYDQKEKGKDAAKAVDFLVKDEQGRVLLTSMVACLFARGVYTDALLAECLTSVGYGTLAGKLAMVSKDIQKLRWRARVATGYRPEDVTIPKRFLEITTGKGPMDPAYLASLKDQYAKAIRGLAAPAAPPA